jgi:hypothetical protein
MVGLNCSGYSIFRASKDKRSIARNGKLLLGVALFLLSSMPAIGFVAQNQIAQPKPEAINANNSTSIAVKENIKTFKVGVSYLNSYPLFSFANIEDKGIGWAILEAFAKENAINFEYVPIPITRLQPLMDSGAIDFIFPDNPLWVAYRSNRYPNIYSGPILTAISATFVSRSNLNMETKDVSKVAIPFGYTAYTWVEPINQYNIQSIPVRDTRAGLNALRINAVDAADVEFNIGQYLISQDSMLANLSVSEHLPSSPVNYHLSSIKHIMILEKLTAFVDANPELIQSLKQKYKIKEYDELFQKK